MLGAATATDVVSLRGVAHTLDIPLLSSMLIGLRVAMPNSVAHTLEPASAVMGALVVAACAWIRPGRLRLATVAG